MVFETIEARLELAAQGFQATIGDAVQSLGMLEGKAGGAHKAVGALGVGMAAVAAGGIAKSISASMDLQSALNESQAIMGDLTQGEMKAMEQAARDIGKTTTFSADEAGSAFYYLASAGMDAEQSVASVGDVAQFAQAGMFSLETATDLATDAQSALGMTAEDTAENAANLNQVMDVLVKSNTLANASVEQFAEALTNKAGAALKNTNKTIEEGAAVLAAYADQGIKGRLAGERLNIVLRDLQKASRENADAFEQLGVQVYDSEGNMRNMADIIADLEEATAGMSTEQQNAALATLGLSQQAADGITPLLGQSEAIRQYESDLGDAGGTSEEIANNQLKSLENQWKILKSQITDIGISIGNVLLPPLTALVGVVTTVVGGFSKFNDATNGMAGTVALLGTLFAGIAMAAGSLSAVIGAGGLSTAVAAAGGALTGLSTAASFVIGPATALVGVLTGLPGLILGAATALNSALLGALTSVASSLIALPGLIFSTATAFASTLATAVMSAVTSFLAFPGAVASAITAKIAATLQAGILSTAYAGLRTAALVAAGGVRALATSLLAMAAPIAVLAVAVGLLYAAWKTNFLGIRDITSGVVAGLKALFAGDFQTIKELIGNVARQARLFWDNNIVPMLETARNLFNRLQNEVIGPFIEWFRPIWEENLAIIRAEFVKTAEVWIQKLSAFVEWARPYVQAFLAALTAWWGKHGEDVMAVVGPLIAFLKRVIIDGMTIIKDVVVGLLRLMRGDFSGFKESVMSIVDTLVTGVIDLFWWLYDTLVGNSIIPDMLSDMVSAWLSFHTELLGAISDFAGDVVQDFKDLASDALNALLDKVSDFRDAGASLIKAVGDGIRDNVPDIKGTVENAAQKVSDYWPRSPAKEGPLSDIDRIGPGLIDSIIRGIRNNTGRLANAASTAAAATRNPLQDIVDKHGEFGAGAAKEAAAALNLDQRHQLADALAETKWFDKDHEAAAALRKAAEGDLSQQLYDGLVSQSGVYGELESLLRQSASGIDKSKLVRAEDGSYVDPSFYSGGRNQAQSRGGDTIIDFSGIPDDAWIRFGDIKDAIKNDQRNASRSSTKKSF